MRKRFWHIDLIATFDMNTRDASRLMSGGESLSVVHFVTGFSQSTHLKCILLSTLLHLPIPAPKVAA